MALSVGAQGIDYTVTPSPAEEESFYNKLLGLADAVVSGQHAQFKLSPAAIEQLKASLALLNAPAATDSRLSNVVAHSANASATNTQQQSAPSAPTFAGLPGLQAQNPHFVNDAAPSLIKATSSGLDPIFLEKSAVLIKAENQHKRQHIERELQAQFKRPGRDEGAEAPSLDMGTILAISATRESHVTGLKRSGRVDSEASSFDTNDYYSSQVQSDWSSPESASKGSDRAADALPADFESLGGPSVRSSFAKTSVSGKQPAVARDDRVSKDAINAQFAPARSTYQVVEDDGDDEDDEYTPPDASVLAGYDEDAGMEEGQIGSDEDDDDDYEPGEVTVNSHAPFPPSTRAGQQRSPKVIRNHLTHIAAPQPNRVSPLAVAKGPNLGGELELVNGRPEVVGHKHNNRHNPNMSRASTASPQNGVGGSNKKRRNKKRKRDNDQQQQTGGGRAKKKRDRHAVPQSPAQYEPRIKDEPVSPLPFAGVPEAQPFAQYAQRPPHYRPAEIDLVSPRHIPLPASPYAPEVRSSGLRYEYAQSASPSVIRVASPAAYRPVQRDNQDLRRVASMQYAHRPPSPGQRAYSPAPKSAVSMAQADPRMSQAPPEMRYQEVPRMQEYHDPYHARPQSPALMPPPAAPAKIVVDQFGNQYYAAAAEPPAPLPPPQAYRASVAPPDRRVATLDTGYDRAPSRAANVYAQPVYERSDTRMAPPPPKRRIGEESGIQYVDANGYAVPAPQYSRPEVRYMEPATSPVYQQMPQVRYEMAPPPTRPARELTSPVYAEPTSPVYAPSRSYSVHPDAPLAPDYTRHASIAPQQYARQGSVAPQQYARPDVPAAPLARATSVMPGYEQPQPQLYAPAPAPQVRYVDQYGREVYQSEPRQVGAPAEYRYQ
ncbi:hypothetical protein Slin15195_G030820 [Septoria linicola]|uniref:Uncharacterized protein n=1 Tax=Septoria linicola TaxID=215465 RepID=A0A9Q9AMP8_9PEZI|nr:hypothetical protein Slin14017_G029840 [Septoria linicola]USW49763.1 hypothetical protein Slin15195_G030820 [Septoria linicola]